MNQINKDLVRLLGFLSDNPKGELTVSLTSNFKKFYRCGKYFYIKLYPNSNASRFIFFVNCLDSILDLIVNLEDSTDNN
jgi:hypothetical protein